MIGCTMAANYFGGAIGTVVAGLLAAFSWRSVFLVNLYVVLVLGVCVFFLPSHKNNVQKAGGATSFCLGAYIFLPRSQWHRCLYSIPA